MLLVLLALIQPSVAKAPDLAAIASIEVDYTMKTSGTVSCETVYKGAGAQPTVEGDRVTFVGTWTVVSDTCNGATIWVPKEGRAHHTLRLGKDKALDEWVVHLNEADNTRFESNIAARGQYWINELASDVNADQVAYTSSETQGIGPLKITIAHDLKISLARGAAPEAPSESP